eukprot:TRINITY_DN68727_c0_g1_i1.p1 TRINITY_DN68727_c0_g1~~TRINITY_DN68727_c0_g1_i1.p1  ORF type:complete len:451 (-),score=80.89 TRINITY_DN68727_c0_g1_i1:380-1732(-)
MAEARSVLTHSAESDAMSDEGHSRGGSEVSMAGACKEMMKNPIALLLVCVPVAFVIHLKETAPIWPFIFNFGAIIPLAWMISECTEHLERLVGPTVGVLLNSTFGNMVEIILSVQAIRNGMVKVVQSSLLGAIIMNLLFVSGLCFFIAGMRKPNEEFNKNSASYQLSLLGLAMLAWIVPTELASSDEWSKADEIFDQSIWIASLLGSMYIMWLAFNLSTHSHLFVTTSAGKKRDSLKKVSMEDGLFEEESSSDEEEEGPQMPGAAAVLILLACTVTVSFHCDWLVESIEPVTKELHIKEAFVATVLLPMVGNFSEIIAALTIASKGKIDLAMGVAIGSATQIALLVVPIAVFISLSVGQKFDLDFESFQIKLLLACVLVANLCLRDGQANWLKGVMMMIAYVVVATAFYWLHDREFRSAGKPPASAQQLQSDFQKLQAQLNALQAAVGKK